MVEVQVVWYMEMGVRSFEFLKGWRSNKNNDESNFNVFGWNVVKVETCQFWVSKRYNINFL